jgi:hypothetical protein
VLIFGANQHDSLLVESILESVPAIKRGGHGHPADGRSSFMETRGYDVPWVRR